MEYYRDDKNRIQAGFALNAGKLLLQYCDIASGRPQDQYYEATLTICVLQSLLTNCAELLAAMRKNRMQKEFWDAIVTDIPKRWGLNSTLIKKNNFPSDLTYAEFIIHLRNALSHPTSSIKKPHLSSTGYTTIKDGDLISTFRFIDSPWINRGELISKYLNADQKKVEENLKVFKDKVKTIETNLRVDRYYENKFAVFMADQPDEPYYPLIEVEIPLKSLINIVLELSNYLAQPVQNDWDGKQVLELVA